MTLAAGPFLDAIGTIPPIRFFGRVAAVQGLLVEVAGVERFLSIGGRVNIVTRDGRRVPCEIVGFREHRALAMPFGTLDGVGVGCRAEVVDGRPLVFPSEAWLGRVINALGEPVDGKGPLTSGKIGVPIRNQPPPAHARRRVGAKIDLGVRARNKVSSCARGHPIGIIA
ncbi:MAG: flagellum-specific ATP synthase FliI, partial [Rhodospirillales bacterium]